MAYPGNQDLSAQAQDRVMSAFRQVVRKLQDGQREEALIGLEFVLRLDPAFRPATNLQGQLASGAPEIDLSSIIGDLQAPTTDAIEALLVDAVEEFERRNFLGAREKVDKVLLELPGHAEARRLAEQVAQALKLETQVGQFLAQAHEALDQGDPQEAANFVMMAQALDPHHAGIHAALDEIYAAGGVPPPPVVAPPPQAPVRLLDGASESVFQVSFTEPAATASGSPEVRARARGHDGPPESIGFELDTAPADRGTASPDDAWGAFPSSDFSFGDELEGDSPAAAALGSDGPMDFDGGVGDVSDLFDAGPLPENGVEPSWSASPEISPEVGAALRAGDEAFAAQSFLEAVHAWSRGLLGDPENPDLHQRIAGARLTIEDLRRRLEDVLEEARSAERAGDRGRALDLAREILTAEPGHVGAAVLRDRLELPSVAAGASLSDLDLASAAAAATALPSLDANLFSENLELGADSAGGLLSDVDVGASQPAAPGGLSRSLSLPVLAAGVVGLVVVLVGVWFGVRLLGQRPDATEADPAVVNQVLVEAQALFDQRRVEEAIQLLQDFQTSGLQRERLDRRIEIFQRELAPPTPTPIPQGLTDGEEFLEAGRFLAAYAAARQGLQTAPQDPGLVELQERIVALEPLARSLNGALAERNFRAAVGLADEYLGRHPGADDGAAALDRSLFNAALAELRGYNLTGAEVYLRRLQQRHPDDTEVLRVLEFVDRYKASPVDIQFQTFTRSLSDR